MRTLRRACEWIAELILRFVDDEFEMWGATLAPEVEARLANMEHQVEVEMRAAMRRRSGEGLRDWILWEHDMQGVEAEDD